MVGLGKRVNLFSPPAHAASVLPFCSLVPLPVPGCGQGLALIDCILRSRQTANWVTILDFDEYFDIGPPLSLPSLLSAHPSAPWFTFGKTWFNVSYCVPPEEGMKESDNQEGVRGGRVGDEFLVERMQLRWPEYYCVYKAKYPQDLCLDFHGHRKYVLNPRKVRPRSPKRVSGAFGIGGLQSLDGWIARTNAKESKPVAQHRGTSRTRGQARWARLLLSRGAAE